MIAMNQIAVTRPTWVERLRAAPAVAAALAVFALAGATLAGAWYFQYVAGLPPCPLCLEERIAYHVVVPLSLLLAIAAAARAPQKLLAVGFIAIIVAALCNVVLGGYHAGVEWHFWAGPTDCTGPLSRSQGGRTAAQSIAVGPCRALRRGGVALSRHFARRL